MFTLIARHSNIKLYLPSIQFGYIIQYTTVVICLAGKFETYYGRMHYGSKVMFILERYVDQTVVSDNLSNEEFMALQIWQLQNIFKDENIAIKDQDLNYIAVSERYMEKFDLEPTLNVRIEHILFDMKKICTDEIEKQEQIIVKQQTPQDSIFIFKEAKRKFLTHYIMRKRPLINPSTNDLVGVFIVAANFKLGFLRKEYFKQLLKLTHQYTKIPLEDTLTSHQYKIVLCLLMGYHSRKEIAGILSNITNEEFNVDQVQNTLKALYRKFECNTPLQLLNLISASNIPLEFPVDVVPEGHYSI